MIKMHKLLLLASLLSTSVFASSSAELIFDMSNKDTSDAKSPWFYCNVVDNAAIPIGALGTRIDMQITDATVKFDGETREYKDLSVGDLKNKYFQVIKGDMQGEGRVKITASNNSDIVCIKNDKGGRLTEYKP